MSLICPYLFPYDLPFPPIISYFFPYDFPRFPYFLLCFPYYFFPIAIFFPHYFLNMSLLFLYFHLNISILIFSIMSLLFPRSSILDPRFSIPDSWSSILHFLTGHLCQANPLINTYNWGKHYLEVLDNKFDGNIDGIFNETVIWDIKWYNWPIWYNIWVCLSMQYAPEWEPQRIQQPPEWYCRGHPQEMALQKHLDAKFHEISLRTILGRLIAG